MFDTQTIFILYSCLAILLVLFFAVFFYFWRKHVKYSKKFLPRVRSSVFLEIQMPKESADKSDTAKSHEERKQIISAAEQIYATISKAGEKHGFFESNDFISLEIAAVNKKISFYINCPKHLQDLIEKQVHAQYPQAQIEEVSAYNPFFGYFEQASTELVLKKKF